MTDADIFILSADDLTEYAENYDADHLHPGDVVWCDGELFLTLDELSLLAHQRRSNLERDDWGDDYREDVERLEDALRRLRQAIDRQSSP